MKKGAKVMKSKMIFFLMFLALGLIGAPATWALSFQDVDFLLSADGSTLTLNINNVDNASGNWEGINDIDALEFKDIGVTTLTSNSGFILVPSSEINAAADGCGTQGNPQGAFCFNTGGALLTNNNTFTFAYSGGTLSSDPHVKVVFSINGEPCTPGCDLLSQAVSVNGVTSTPEPASLMLLGAGLLGLAVWKRQSA
jgi:hypothetical protein